MPRSAWTLAASAATLLTLALPSVATAAVSPTIHNDGGVPVGVTPGLTISNMAPKVALSFTPAEGDTRAKLAVTGPDGAAATTGGTYCLSLKNLGSDSVRYRGNGAYTITWTLFAADDTSCRTPIAGGGSAVVTIAAGMALQVPPTPVLTRDPGTSFPKTYQFPAAGSPNNFGLKILYANGGVFNPAIGIEGVPETAYGASTTGLANYHFKTPGTYTVTGRTSAGSPEFFTPWTAPQRIVAVAPFDLEAHRFLDRRGPSYRLSFQARERSLNGPVRVRVRRVAGGGKYRTIGRPMARGGHFTKRFTLRRSGRYQLRLEWGGSPTVAAGMIRLGIRVYRY